MSVPSKSNRNAGVSGLGTILNGSFEEMDDFASGFLGNISRSFGCLLGALRYIRADLFGGARGEVASLFGAVFGLHGNCLGTMIHVNSRHLHGFQTIVSQFVYFVGRLLCSSATSFPP